MIWYIFWVVTSFFAVIGVLQCILSAVELWTLRRNHSVMRAVFRLELEGEEPYVEYLLNTLTVMTGKLAVGEVEAELELVDRGLSPKARCEVEEYCNKNPWVLFTDGREDDIIIK